MGREQRRLAAIVAADVVGYSRLMGRDESGTLARLRALRSTLIDPRIAGNGGRIVKTTGDGLLVEFGSVVDAMRCVVTVQREVARHEAAQPADRRMELRIGVHMGDIVIDGDDILGDGVNVAARLEALAEPGGVCVSGRVQEDLVGKFDLDLRDGGEQTLKNIARPVRVWHWSPEDRVVPATELPRAGAPLALPDKPSIAVLPFTNMSGDPEQEYFADGMVEDIITALSRFKSLFVIARNSSFAYKGQSPDVRKVGRDLGVRYVLEGSVRRAANRIRITSQLIDAGDGAHLWADRFEGALENVFDLQDAVTSNVVGIIAPRMEQAEIEYARIKSATNLKAYDLLLRAQSLMRLRGRTEILQALDMLRHAASIDPANARVLANLSLCCWIFIAQGHGHRDDPVVADVVQLAQKALALDAGDSEIVAIAASSLGVPGGDLETGIALVEKAVALNPNNAEAFRIGGVLYAFAGQVEKAIEYQQRADRLNPLYTGWNLGVGYVLAHFGSGAYEEVLNWTAKILREQPTQAPALRYRAASLGLLGRLEEARQVVAHILEQTPDYTITEVRRHHEFDMNNPFKAPGASEALYRGLRLAGLPE